MPLIKLGTIYFKTDAGRAEIATRSGKVDAVPRRLLIMVDGKKTVNDLGAYVRVGELVAALAYLEMQGLIESGQTPIHLLAPVAPGFAAPASDTEAPRAATCQQAFAKLRSDASGFVAERLGTSGAPISEAIERCKSPEELRRLLRGVEIFVSDKLDAQTAQTFARQFGKLLL